MESFIDSVDFFKGNNPEEIAEKYGTPVYVYNEDIIRDRMLRVASVIRKYPYRANYSCKTNTIITDRIACNKITPSKTYPYTRVSIGL